MITWRGTGYMLLIAATWFVLAAIGYEPLALLLPVLIILPFLSLIRLLITFRSLQVGQRLEPYIIERKETSTLNINLRQYGWFSHGELELIIKKPFLYEEIQHVRKTAVLLAGTSREFSWQLPGQNRGRFRPGLYSLRSRDLFGFFSLPSGYRQRLNQSAPELIVLPNSNSLPSIDNLISFLAQCEIKQNPFIGDEVDAIANIRAWRPGDSMKRTHWKVSARLDRTMVKEYELPVRHAGLLLIDMARPAGIAADSRRLTDLADILTDQAASLVKHLLVHENSLRIVAYDPKGRKEVLASKHDDLLTAQLMLTDLGWSDQWDPFHALIEETGLEKSCGFVVYFTSRLNEAAMSRMLALHQKGIPAWLILALEPDPDDKRSQEMLGKYKANGLLLTILGQPDAGGESKAI